MGSEQCWRGGRGDRDTRRLFTKTIGSSSNSKGVNEAKLGRGEKYVILAPRLVSCMYIFWIGYIAREEAGERGGVLPQSLYGRKEHPCFLSGRREPIWRSVNRFFDRELKLSQLTFFLSSFLVCDGEANVSSQQQASCTKDVHRPVVGEGVGDAVKFSHATMLLFTIIYFVRQTQPAMYVFVFAHGFLCRCGCFYYCCDGRP
ncbi:unnamed protein product, partial [Ectocarpus sp. 8 AP-2014]